MVRQMELASALSDSQMANDVMEKAITDFNFRRRFLFLNQFIHQVSIQNMS